MADGRADLADPAIIREFRARQARFQQRVTAALDGAPTRLAKVQEYLRMELGPRWKKELDRRREAYSEARRRWLEAEADVKASGRRGAVDKESAMEERREMNRAQRRCEEAEEKLAAVKTWLARLDGDGKDLLAKVRDHDLALQDLCRGALARLDQLATNVDEYLRKGEPGMSRSGGVDGDEAMLEGALRDLMQDWAATGDGWRDAARSDFDRDFITQIDWRTRHALRALGELATLCAEAQRRCE